MRRSLSPPSSSKSQSSRKGPLSEIGRASCRERERAWAEGGRFGADANPTFTKRALGVGCRWRNASAATPIANRRRSAAVARPWKDGGTANGERGHKHLDCSYG